MFALYALVIYFGGWEVNQGIVDFNGAARAVLLAVGPMRLPRATRASLPAAGMFKGFLAILMAAMGMAQGELIRVFCLKTLMHGSWQARLCSNQLYDRR